MNSHQRRKERREFERWVTANVAFGAGLEATLGPLHRFGDVMGRLGRQLATMNAPRTLLRPSDPVTQQQPLFGPCRLSVGIRSTFRTPVSPV